MVHSRQSLFLDCQELNEKAQLDGIVGGFAVVGKGIKKVEW